jgi:general secretion pathway protein K
MSQRDTKENENPPLPPLAKGGKGGFSEQKGGVALILVVWILVILIVIVGEFSYSMRTELKIMRNFKEEEEAYQIALAGIELAKIEIMAANSSTYVYMNEDGIMAFGNKDENLMREGKIEKGSFTYTITDEDGKLNINNATIQQLKYIIQNTGVEITDVDTIADSIVDWRDTNDLHMLNGAEEDYYQSLEKPYGCKDGPFDVVDELMLVKGVTQEIFYGSSRRVESATGDETERKYAGIEQYFTSWGSNTVNINTAPEIVLEAVLGAVTAGSIIKQREVSPVLNPVGGGKIMSSFFTIISTGAIRDGTIKRTIKVVLKINGKKLDTIYWNDNFI